MKLECPFYLNVVFTPQHKWEPLFNGHDKFFGSPSFHKAVSKRKELMELIKEEPDNWNYWYRNSNNFKTVRIDNFEPIRNKP